MSSHKPIDEIGFSDPHRGSVFTGIFLISWLGLAAGASAAKIVDLKVSPGADATEVVFELDQPAGYRLERNQTSSRRDRSELLLSIDAEASDRTLEFLSSLVSQLIVLKNGDDPTTVRIALREPGLVVRDRVLVNPPRLVLSFSRPVGNDTVNPISVPAAPATFANAAPAAEEATSPPGNLREIRVGSHPTFSRLVFELDGPVSYQLDLQNGTDLLVKLGATSKEMNIRFHSKSDIISSVRVTKGDGTTLARVRLTGKNLRIKDFVLSNPYRIVLDVSPR